jgi:hypothetical protein
MQTALPLLGLVTGLLVLSMRKGSWQRKSEPGAGGSCVVFCAEAGWVQSQVGHRQVRINHSNFRSSWFV